MMKAQVLVVQEKSGYFRDKNVWKLPTGVVHEVKQTHLSTQTKRNVIKVLEYM